MSNSSARHVYVISDLHLGGRPQRKPGEAGPPGAQLCHSYAALIAFIDWVAGQAKPGAAIELVINGDIVDFLAEDDYPDAQAQVFLPDQDAVVTRLRMINQRTAAANDGQRGVLEALRDLLKAGRRLTLLLGNHDVELALPRVRAWLTEQLGGENPRLHFYHDGEAYTAGGLLIEHGNRYDRWNQIDHSGLRQERSVLSRRLPVNEALRSKYYFVPPPGTHLVVHFMNRIKDRYRFVDLLKPETAAVIPMLLALEPEQRPHLERILRAVPMALALASKGMDEDTLPRRPGDLAAGQAQGVEGALEEALGEEARWFREPPSVNVQGQMAAGGGDGLLYRTEHWLQKKIEAWAPNARSWLGLGGVALAPDSDERRHQLHLALWRLAQADRAFRLEEEDPEYFKAAQKTAMSGGFQCVVYGHTHLPKRKITEPQGQGARWTYLNTGTWADVIRVPRMSGKINQAGHPYDPVYAEDLPVLEAFIKDLQNNQLAGHIQRYLTYACIELDAAEQVQSADLFSYCGAQKEASPPHTSYPTG